VVRVLWLQAEAALQEQETHMVLGLMGRNDSGSLFSCEKFWGKIHVALFVVI
jgi:hypothetical protein